MRLWRLCHPAPLLAAAATLLLLGCAAPYVPHAGDDAAKLRLRLGVGPAWLGTLTSNLRPVVDGRCGEPVRVPQLATYTPPSTAGGPARGPTANDPAAAYQYPRAGMHESPEPTRSDVAELRLAPGRFMVTMIGALGPRHCRLVTVLDLEAGRQYGADLRLDEMPGQCTLRSTRLETQDGTPRWQRYARVPADVCPAS